MQMYVIIKPLVYYNTSFLRLKVWKAIFTVMFINLYRNHVYLNRGEQKMTYYIQCEYQPTKIDEGADRVRGRGEKRGREGGEEGEGGGRRGGGRREKRRREKRGWKEGEGRKKGREGERGNFCAREARAAPEGRRETRGREGEVRGREGGEAYPPVHPLIDHELHCVYTKCTLVELLHYILNCNHLGMTLVIWSNWTQYI